MKFIPERHIERRKKFGNSINSFSFGEFGTHLLAVASVSLDLLFSGQDICDSQGQLLRGRLRLPEYQRPYRWSSSQVVQLADDLERHTKLAPGHDYYLGSLILHQSGDGWLNIIDGQQRLTSIGIMCLLAGVSSLPELSYRSPESQQRIRDNLADLHRLNLKVQLDLAQINVTLVVTRSEDDAYRFFETQNSGGIRLSGIDIAKAHHLRAVNKSRLNEYARRWEALGNLGPVVDCVMRGRHWQSLDWRELTSKQRQPREWRDQVVEELATNTGDGGLDLAFQLGVNERTQQEWREHPKIWQYDLRQPLHAGSNSIHFLEQFHSLLSRYCPDRLAVEAQSEPWAMLYIELVSSSDASPFLRKLYDAALALYISRFGDGRLEEVGLWLFRAVYSLRLSNEKMVRESSVQRFVRENPVLDWIAHSYTHADVIRRLRNFKYQIRPEQLDTVGGKKLRHVDAVCEALQFTLAGTTATEIVEKFDIELRRAIELRCLPLNNLACPV